MATRIMKAFSRAACGRFQWLGRGCGEANLLRVNCLGSGPDSNQVRTVRFLILGGHHNGRNSNDVDDGAYSASKTPDRCRTFVCADCPRDRSEPQRCNSQSESTWSIAFQKPRRAARTSRLKGCTFQKGDSAADTSSVAEGAATCVRRGARW